jgi:hypothetical protein
MAHVPTYHSASATNIARHVDSELLRESRNTAVLVVFGYRARNFCQKDCTKSKKCDAVSLVDVPLGVSAHVFLSCRPSLAFPTKQIADKKLLERVLGLTFHGGGDQTTRLRTGLWSFHSPDLVSSVDGYGQNCLLAHLFKRRVSRMADVDVGGENVLASSFFRSNSHLT